jgi:hypothetical protein
VSEVGCDIVEYLKEFHTSEGKAVKALESCVYCLMYMRNS